MFRSLLAIFFFLAVTVFSQEFTPKDEFESVDIDADGFITEEELKSVFPGEEKAQQMMHNIFNNVDKNGDGKISLEEHLEYAKVADENDKEIFKKWFQRIDTNNDGKLDLNEMIKSDDWTGTKGKTQEQIEIGDTNKDKVLDEQEFVQWGLQQGE